MNYVDRLSSNSLAIFLLHGVICSYKYKIRNYTRKHLDRDYFYEVMKSLRQSGQPVSLDDVISCHRNRQPFPSRAFAVTFDDGFENNATVAAPILADLGIPATYYVTTDFIDRNSMSWIDRIECCFEKVGAAKIRLPWRDESFAFQKPEESRPLLDEIRAYVKNHREFQINPFVSDIFHQCGQPEIFQSDDPLDRKMSWEQVQKLHGTAGFTVGGHTHTHSILSFLPEHELHREISMSLESLKMKAGIGARHYSYPEGLAHCFSDTVIDRLKNAGVECCPTAIDGVNVPETDLFHLKRIFLV